MEVWSRLHGRREKLLRFPGPQRTVDLPPEVMETEPVAPDHTRKLQGTEESKPRSSRSHACLQCLPELLQHLSGLDSRTGCKNYVVQTQVNSLKEVPLANGQPGTQVVDEAIDLISNPAVQRTGTTLQLLWFKPAV